MYFSHGSLVFSDIPFYIYDKNPTSSEGQLLDWIVFLKLCVTQFFLKCEEKWIGESLNKDLTAN